MNPIYEILVYILISTITTQGKEVTVLVTTVFKSNKSDNFTVVIERLRVYKDETHLYS